MTFLTIYALITLAVLVFVLWASPVIAQTTDAVRAQRERDEAASRAEYP